jgi:hypothetical protein
MALQVGRGRAARPKYESARKNVLRVSYGDLESKGAADIFEAYLDEATQRVVPWRALDSLASAMPSLRERFPTFLACAMASLSDLLGENAKRAQELQAIWLDSTLFLNRGDKFEVRPLPIEAQFAPAFGLSVGDCDGDGREDVFLSQNFFATQPETSRYDAGRGLWLQGNGEGGFRAVPGQESGVLVYGEQRGCALGDYDGDGRLDLVVTQNAAATKLFHNRRGTPGLRIRLKGPPGNPGGVGAAIRLVFGGRFGPVREIHAGSGYWSQDSAVAVMATPESPSRVWIRWPGGKTTISEIPAGAREVTIEPSGAL